MKRSGNIGAAKNMDSVFANYTDDELEQDLIFDEDDQLVEIVEGYTEDGNTIFEEDEEIFKIAHQIEADNDDTPDDVRKDAEKLLGPDNDTDQKIDGIENVKDEKIDDSQEIDNLKKNGESEADKELGLDKLEDEYHKDATVAEGYEKWLREMYESEDEDKVEGADTKFGDKKLDNSQPTDDLSNKEDENYQDTADASVKEEYDYDNEKRAEGSKTNFGDKKLDNSQPTDDVSPKGDDNYNDTDDATVKDEPFDEAAFDKWLLEGVDGEYDHPEDCSCGKDDCPICSKKKELAPDSAPVADVSGGDERHEESSNEPAGIEGEEGAAPGKVDDNTLPKEDDMTPDESPESDNGDITNDDDITIDELFSGWIKEEADLETPLGDGETPILPEDVEKIEDDLEKSAPESDAEIAEASLHEEEEEVVEHVPTEEQEDKAGTDSAPESTDKDLVESFLDSIFESDEEEKEEELPSKEDVEDAAKVEVEDTESELDDDLAVDELESDIEGSDDDDVDLEYDPSDEELIDIAGGVDEAALLEAKNPERTEIANKIKNALYKCIMNNLGFDSKDFHLMYNRFSLLGTGKGKVNKEFLAGNGKELWFLITAGIKASDFFVNTQMNRMGRAFGQIESDIKKNNAKYIAALNKATGKSTSISSDAKGVNYFIKVTVK